MGASNVLVCRIISLCFCNSGERCALSRQTTWTGRVKTREPQCSGQLGMKGFWSQPGTIRSVESGAETIKTLDMGILIRMTLTTSMTLLATWAGRRSTSKGALPCFAMFLGLCQCWQLFLGIQVCSHVLLPRRPARRSFTDNEPPFSHWKRTISYVQQPLPCLSRTPLVPTVCSTIYLHLQEWWQLNCCQQGQGRESLGTTRVWCNHSIQAWILQHLASQDHPLRRETHMYTNLDFFPVGVAVVCVLGGFIFAIWASQEMLEAGADFQEWHWAPWLVQCGCISAWMCGKCLPMLV